MISGVELKPGLLIGRTNLKRRFKEWKEDTPRWVSACQASYTSPGLGGWWEDLAPLDYGSWWSSIFKAGFDKWKEDPLG